MHLLIRLATSMLLAFALAAAEDKPSNPAPLEAVIIPVKTLRGDSFTRLSNMLKVFDVRYIADDKLRTILVYAQPNIVSQIRRVVEQLDQPGSEAAIGHNIEMNLTFLRCSLKPSSEPRPLPQELEPVARQLRAAMPYKNIELWESLPLRMQEGKEARQELRLPGALPGLDKIPATVDFEILPEAVIRKEESRYVRFASIYIHFGIPYTTGPAHSQTVGRMDLRLKTAGDFKEGQKTVLGKVSGVEEETATFVVISLKVVD